MFPFAGFLYRLQVSVTILCQVVLMLAERMLETTGNPLRKRPAPRPPPYPPPASSFHQQAPTRTVGGDSPGTTTATGFGITPQPDEHTFTKHNGTNPTVPIGTQGSRQQTLDVFGLIREMEYESSNVNKKRTWRRRTLWTQATGERKFVRPHIQNRPSRGRLANASVSLAHRTRDGVRACTRWHADK